MPSKARTPAEYSLGLVQAVLMTMYEDTSSPEVVELRTDVKAGLAKLPAHRRHALILRAQGMTDMEFKKLLGGRISDVKLWFRLVEEDLTDILNGREPQLESFLRAA